MILFLYMTQPEEYSQSRQFARLLLPSIAELQTYVIISFVLLAVGTLTALNNWLGISSDLANTQTAINQVLQNFLQTIDGQTFTPTLVVMVFWGGVGSIVYILLWFVLNIYVSFHNDVVVAASFIKPSYYPSSNSWLEIMERSLLRAAAAFAIIGFTAVMIMMLIPVWALLFSAAVHEWRNIQALVGGLMAVIGLVLSMHIYVILFRLLLLRVRIFGSVEI